MYRIWYTDFVGKKPKPFLDQTCRLSRLNDKASEFRPSSIALKPAESRCGNGSRGCQPMTGNASERISRPWSSAGRSGFYIDKRSRMVLLHGFIKKTQKTPYEDLELARSNKNKHQGGLK